MRHMRPIIVFVLIVGTALRIQASGTEITQEGDAQVIQGDTVAAKELAIRVALRRCVEQVVGLTVRSIFSSQQQSIVKNNQEAFDAKVSERLETHSDGFIQTYTVLDSRVDKDVMHVTVHAVVYESAVKAEVEKFADMLTQAGNPKLMLVLQELHEAPHVEEYSARDPILASYIEQELMLRGFELRGQSVGHKVGAMGGKEFDAWMANPAGGLQTAREAGADVLIFGRVHIKNCGPIGADSSFAALVGQVQVEIFAQVQAVDVASGRIYSSQPVQQKTYGVSEERAVYRAFHGQGNNVTKQIFTGLLDNLCAGFSKMAASGQPYLIQVTGVKNFRRQATPFLAALKGVKGVSTVTQKSFDAAGTLAIEVLCKCTTGELQQGIFNATESADVLKSLDLAGVSGKRLSFKL